MIEALIAQLLKSGVIDDDGIDAIADNLDGRGKEDEAHIVRCILLEDMAPSEAETRRSHIRLFKGGKSDDD